MPRPSRNSPAASFLTVDGKLPPFARRRLEELLDKNKSAAGLAAGEDRELREMLRFIDRKNVELLRQASAT